MAVYCTKFLQFIPWRRSKCSLPLALQGSCFHYLKSDHGAILLWHLANLKMASWAWRFPRAIARRLNCPKKNIKTDQTKIRKEEILWKKLSLKLDMPWNNPEAEHQRKAVMSQSNCSDIQNTFLHQNSSIAKHNIFRLWTSQISCTNKCQ